MSNSMHTNTGYGVATKSVIQEMVKEGRHTPRVLAYYGIEGGEVELDGVQHLPRFGMTYGEDIIEGYNVLYNIDLNVICRDIWVNDIELSAMLPTLAWFPIDHFPVSAEIQERMKVTKWLATMSHFGVKEIEKAGFSATYLPHSFNPTDFFPSINADDKKADRQYCLPNVPPDAYLVTSVAANKGFPARKGWSEMFIAMAEVMRRDPNVYYYCHTNCTSSDSGPDLRRLAQATGLDLNRTILLNPYKNIIGVDARDLGRIYRASDLLLNCSYGEGFGIPIIEAQACGLPVITTAHSSMPELTFSGLTVRGAPMMTPHYGYWMIPNIQEIIDAVIDIKDNPKNYAPKFVAGLLAHPGPRCFTDSYVYETYWMPLLEKIEQELAMMKGTTVAF